VRYWYIDDDPDDRELLFDAMASLYPDVVFTLFSNGEEAIKQIPACTDDVPNLIVLDLNMPCLSGKDILPVIKAFPKFSDTKFAVFSTSSSPTDKKWAEQNEALFITKPFTTKGFIAAAKMLHDYCPAQTESK
jgi:CheY-like chemotaxis protein